MRIEPEEVLKEKRIASDCWIEDSDTDESLKRDKNDGDSDDGGAKHHDNRCCVVRPDV